MRFQEVVYIPICLSKSIASYRKLELLDQGIAFAEGCRTYGNLQ